MRSHKQLKALRMAKVTRAMRYPQISAYSQDRIRDRKCFARMSRRPSERLDADWLPNHHLWDSDRDWESADGSLVMLQT